uniref:Semaphorin 6C n=1 Tax=Apteryx owenii TaxID=8824 RepID=A0A8B9P294_APTOW
MPPTVFLLLLLLLFLLLLILGGPGGMALSFPRDLVARSTVGLAGTAAYPRFSGLRDDNVTAQLGLDFQRMLRLNGTLFVAARAQPPPLAQQHLTWEMRDRENCAMRGKLQDECYNYIKVLVPRDARTLFACGTNAFNPLCRTYEVGSLTQEGEEVSGQARCPFDAKQSNVALFADGSLYSATVADFQASDAVIYRSLGEGSPPLRTLKYSSRWLQEPHFVQALPYGPYVYFFFREIAVELSALGKVAVARVARVCRNDGGGSPRVLERRWTSFLKARLNCSVPGDAVFYFDVLEAVTPPRRLHGRPAVLALFGTQRNSIPGSAVCAFYLADVERAFEGRFQEQRGSDGAWTPVPEERVLRAGRPGRRAAGHLLPGSRSTQGCRDPPGAPRRAPPPTRGAPTARPPPLPPAAAPPRGPKRPGAAPGAGPAAHPGAHAGAAGQDAAGARSRHPGVPPSRRAGAPTQGHPGRAAAAAARGRRLGVAGGSEPARGIRLLWEAGAAGRRPVFRRAAFRRAPRQPAAAAAAGAETLAGGATGGATRPGAGTHPDALGGGRRGAGAGAPARRPRALALGQAPAAAQTPAGARGPRAALSHPGGHGDVLVPSPPPGQGLRDGIQGWGSPSCPHLPALGDGGPRVAISMRWVIGSPCPQAVPSSLPQVTGSPCPRAAPGSLPWMMGVPMFPSHPHLPG